jgi:serine protease AprX
MPYVTVHPASWRWIRTTTVVAMVVFALAATLMFSQAANLGGGNAAQPATPNVSPSLLKLAHAHPARSVEVIVQVERGFDHAAVRSQVAAHGGHVTREVRLINGLAADIPAAEAVELSGENGVRAVSINASVAKTSLIDIGRLTTAYGLSIGADTSWKAGFTGKGVGVAVIDTGIAGGLPDFQVSQSDPTSRVVANAVVNPAASTPTDGYGHGTHIAGLVAGNGNNLPASSPNYAKYTGIAPDANLIAVKAGDETGGATVLDVIDGLQFVVDHKSDYNIKVVNLSLRSTNAESYKTDPLDAAVESAWFNGIVVVAASGNNGAAADAVSYGPANDPYVITVGGVDDKGTKSTSDDSLAYWSSRGTTQDGFAKPDVVAPGAHLTSTLSPGSAYASLCTTCVTDGSYFTVSGTSMAAGVASGAIADAIQAHPTWTPDQIKSTFIKRSRDLKGVISAVGLLLDSGTVTGKEILVDKVIVANPEPPANQKLTPNTLVDPTTGAIDYTRASWSRASWSEAADPLRASWSRASWSRASWSRASWSATPVSCSDFERASWSRASWSDADIQYAKDACTQMDPTRASWSGTDFTRASWSTFYDG